MGFITATQQLVNDCWLTCGVYGPGIKHIKTKKYVNENKYVMNLAALKHSTGDDRTHSALNSIRMGCYLTRFMFPLDKVYLADIHTQTHEHTHTQMQTKTTAKEPLSVCGLGLVPNETVNHYVYGKSMIQS